MSSSDNESEAGPSRSPPPTIEAGEKKGQGQGRKRKAGGDGKKGKIFLEDKVSSLSSCYILHICLMRVTGLGWKG